MGLATSRMDADTKPHGPGPGQEPGHGECQGQGEASILLLSPDTPQHIRPFSQDCTDDILHFLVANSATVTFARSMCTPSSRTGTILATWYWTTHCSTRPPRLRAFGT